MRLALAEMPKCEVCGKKQATMDASVKFNGQKAAWCYCCEDCQAEYGTGAHDSLEVRDKDWKPVAAMASALAKLPKKKAAAKKTTGG